jgi:outer membrane protein TolC
MKRNSCIGSLIGAAVLLSAISAPCQAPNRLTLKDAIERGLQHNLRVLLAGDQIREAEGTRERLRANLLPRSQGEFLGVVQTRSLQALGIEVPGIPAVVGPFSTYDFRLSLDQPLLDLQSYYRWKAGGEREQATRHDYQNVRDLIVQQIASLYLNAQAAAARVEAAGSRVATAEALQKLAHDQRQVGVATGVDLLRAQVQLANERQRLLEARNAAQQSLLQLARAIAQSLGTSLELAEPLEFKPIDLPSIASALETALASRADYLSLQRQHQALAEERKATRARYLPRFRVASNYGAIGRSLGDLRATGAVQGTLSFTVFDRDRKGEELEVENRLKRLDHELADLRLGIEQEIREALLVLESAAQEVRVAREGRGLAERELELARERFQAGVTNNVEVVTAQDALSRAQENYILSLTRHADARMALARALGDTERIYEKYLGIQ